MTQEEKEAIELLKKLSKTKPYIIWGDNDVPYNKANQIKTILNLIEKQQAEIEKKDKIIDLMADKLSEYTCWNKDNLNMNKLIPIEDIIEYFTKKVEEGK